MSTKEFLYRFEENDELQHRIDMEFDEWVGQLRMLESLREEADSLRGIQSQDVLISIYGCLEKSNFSL